MRRARWSRALNLDLTADRAWARYVPHMFGLGVPELFIVSVFYLVVPALLLYWVIRLAVRHGVMDAQRRLRETTPLDR